MQLLTLALVLVTVVIALANAKSAKASRDAATATKTGMLAQNMGSIIDEYRGLQMRDDIRLLAEIKRQQGDDLLVAWKARCFAPDDFNKIDIARRNLYWFYRKCWELETAGLLPGEFFDSFIRRNNGYAVFHEVAGPLSATVNPARADERIAWIDAMCAKYPPDQMW